MSCSVGVSIHKALDFTPCPPGTEKKKKKNKPPYRWVKKLVRIRSVRMLQEK